VYAQHIICTPHIKQAAFSGDDKYIFRKVNNKLRPLNTDIILLLTYLSHILLVLTFYVGMYIVTLSLTSSLDVGGWSTPPPGRFIPGKDQVPIV
jgi:uncharacterized membrane protein